MDKVDAYFQKRNIDASFNTLGGSEKLVALYAKETRPIVINSQTKRSHEVKHACYNNYYNIEARTKYTGFEKVEELDRKTRHLMSQKVSGLLGTPVEKLDTWTNVTGDYLAELKIKLSSFKDPLLYLSGGIDSEFVALAMLDAGIKFTPVIFRWINDQDQVFNIHDILYALDFCDKHNLQPLIRQVNIEKLWTNDEFINMAVETNINSPHINTYVYMIEMMASEFPNSTHVMGGEVRYAIYDEEGQDTPVTILHSAKLSNPGFSADYLHLYNATYNNTSAPGSAQGYFTTNLVLNWAGFGSTGTWSFYTQTQSTNPTLTRISGAAATTSGTWYNGSATPSADSIRWRSRVSTDGGSTWGSWGSYITINVGDNSMGLTNSPPTGKQTSSLQNRTFEIEVQTLVSGTPNGTVTWTINLRCQYVYTPTSFTYSSAGAFNLPSGATGYSDMISVGGIGGGAAGGGARRTSGPANTQVGASGGGGGAGAYDDLKEVAYLTGNGVIGAGGAGVAGANGGNGSATTLSGTAPGGPYSINLPGGTGGLTNSPDSNVGGGGGTSSYPRSGGTGAAGVYTYSSWSGGGAGWGPDGQNNSNGSFYGLGGSQFPGTDLPMNGTNFAVPACGAGGSGNGGNSATNTTVDGGTALTIGGGGRGSYLSTLTNGSGVASATAIGGAGNAGHIWAYY